MKNSNEKILNEANYSDALPSFDDSTKEAPKKQINKMDFSTLLPNFITGAKLITSTKEQPKPAQPATPVAHVQNTTSTTKEEPKIGQSDVTLPDGYDDVSSVSKLNSFFDAKEVEKIKKELENAPTASLNNINGKLSDVGVKGGKVTIYANGNEATVDKQLLRDYYLMGKSDANIAYFIVRRNIGSLIAKHVTINGIEIVEFEDGKILLLNEDIFKVLFK